MDLLIEPLRGPVAPALALLSIDERSRADRLRDPRLRQRFILAHAFVRRALADRLDCDPASLVLRPAATGKPELADRPRPWHFSLSHSDALAALALAAEHPVGIDIERERPLDALQLARLYFAPGEVAELAALADPVPRFYRLWTRKEAVLKAHGLGITGSLSTLPPAPVCSFRPAAGFAGAVAWLRA